MSVRWPVRFFVVVLSFQSCPNLSDPMDCSPPGCSVHRILQARIWSGLPCPPPGIFPTQGSNQVSHFFGRWVHYYHCHLGGPGIIILSSNSTSGKIAKGNEICISKRYQYSEVHCSIIHNSQDMEAS